MQVKNACMLNDKQRIETCCQTMLEPSCVRVLAGGPCWQQRRSLLTLLRVCVCVCRFVYVFVQACMFECLLQPRVQVCAKHICDLMCNDQRCPSSHNNTVKQNVSLLQSIQRSHIHKNNTPLFYASNWTRTCPPSSTPSSTTNCTNTACFPLSHSPLPSLPFSCVTSRPYKFQHANCTQLACLASRTRCTRNRNCRHGGAPCTSHLWVSCLFGNKYPSCSCNTTQGSPPAMSPAATRRPSSTHEQGSLSGESLALVMVYCVICTAGVWVSSRYSSHAPPGDAP